MTTRTVAYWPGCVSRGFTPELHGAMALVAPKLGLNLVQLDRGSCTGAGVLAEHNQELTDTLNGRTFALAQKVDQAEFMMNICSPARARRASRRSASTRTRSTATRSTTRSRSSASRTRRASSTRTSCGCSSRTSASTPSSRSW